MRTYLTFGVQGPSRPALSSIVGVVVPSSTRIGTGITGWDDSGGGTARGSAEELIPG